MLQGSEPSYLERAEQLQAVMCSAMEKVGRGRGLGAEGAGLGAALCQTRWGALCCAPDPSLPQNVLGGQDQLRIRVAELEDEVRNLRKINRDLFDFSTRVITRPAK